MLCSVPFHRLFVWRTPAGLSALVSPCPCLWVTTLSRYHSVPSIVEAHASSVMLLRSIKIIMISQTPRLPDFFGKKLGEVLKLYQMITTYQIWSSIIRTGVIVLCCSLKEVKLVIKEVRLSPFV